MKKYKCPNCHQELSYIRYEEGNSMCYGITIKCNKCGNIVPLKLENVKKVKITL